MFLSLNERVAIDRVGINYGWEPALRIRLELVFGVAMAMMPYKGSSSEFSIAQPLLVLVFHDILFIIQSQ